MTKTVTFAYDYLNRWVATEVDATPGTAGGETSEYFVYGGATLLDGVSPWDRAAVDSRDIGQITLRLDDTEKITNRYLWGPAVDQILADEQVEWNAGAHDYDIDRILWPLTDHQGTVRDLAKVNGSGVTEIVNTRTYDAYGNLLTESAPAVDHLFGYTGRVTQTDAGLQNNLNRWYDPEIGRFVSEDPIVFRGGDANLARYCGNDPVNAVDPSGLATSPAALREALDYARLARAAYGPQYAFGLPEGWKVEKYIDVPRLGYKAAIIKNEKTGEVVLAFAGTDDMMDWWTNFLQGAGEQGLDWYLDQYDLAIDLAKKMKKEYGDKLTIVGHSLGGGLASAAALATDTEAVTYNPAGLHPITIAKLPFGKKAKTLIDAYRVRGEVLTTVQDSLIIAPDTTGRVHSMWPAEGCGINPITLHGMDTVIKTLKKEIELADMAEAARKRQEAQMNQGGFLNPNNWLRHFFRITPPGGGLSGPAF